MTDKSADALLDEALAILSDRKYESYPKYAFTCRKCAWVYGYFGRIADERFLNERADEIYERA